MIESIVEPPAYQIANHYLAENRVRIVEADESQISSVVIGNSGVYDQAIRLKDGSLGTKCTCTLNEQPFCRHAVAALLEYHRWVKPKGVQRPPERPAHDRPAGQPARSAPALDMKLSEVTVFVEWFQAVVKALEGGQPLPSGPNMIVGEVCGWILAVQNLEHRRRTGEEKRVALEADLRDRDDQISRLNQQLQVAMQETREARATVENLQRQLAGHAGLLTRVAELTQDIDRFDSQIKGLSGELVQKASQLDRLGTAWKEISAALQGLIKPQSR
ncbi:MAG: hypothetical protein ACREJU_08035 [Nitrospiraceae bacterium]